VVFVTLGSAQVHDALYAGSELRDELLILHQVGIDHDVGKLPHLLVAVVVRHGSLYSRDVVGPVVRGMRTVCTRPRSLHKRSDSLGDDPSVSGPVQSDSVASEALRRIFANATSPWGETQRFAVE